MKHFKVKVCGITRPGDAKLAAELGADFVGMIFYRSSPRKVTIKKARAIVVALPPTVSPVGVFVNEDADKIIRIARRLRLDFVQLSGEEPTSDIAKLKRNGLKVINVFHSLDRATIRKMKNNPAKLVMVDNSSGGLRGGTGKTFDWSQSKLTGIKNLVLAGGITAANVRAGVKQFSPLVIDVNSGVESSPGIKSKTKLRRFFKVCNSLRYGN